MNKKALFLILVVTVFVLLISGWVKNFTAKRSAYNLKQVENKNVNALYDRGMAFYKEGKYKEASTSFSALVNSSSENPKTKESLLLLAKSYEAGKDYNNTKKALEEYTKRYSDSPDVSSVQKNLEKINIDILFSNTPTETSTIYEIKRGDTLGKIAANFNTTVELIKKANGLKSDIIIPGKYLKVNDTAFVILVDKSENTLILKKENGKIIKTYIVSTGENLCTPTGSFKIEEKLISPVWYKVGAVVSPDAEEYELGTRWMGLSVEGYGIHGTKDESLIGKHITKGCVRMKNDEVEELYAIVPSGAEVTITE